MVRRLAVIVAVAIAAAACGTTDRSTQTTEPVPSEATPATTVAAAAPASTTAPSTTGGLDPVETSSTTTTTAPGLVLRFSAFHGGVPHGDWIQEQVAAFEAANPEVDVELTLTDLYAAPVPYSAIVEQWIDAETPPDLVAGYVGGVMEEYQEQGFFADLSKIWDESGLGVDVAPAVADLSSIGDTRYWVPIFAQPNPIYYRPTIFEAASVKPPESWDELLATCEPLAAIDGVELPITVGGARWRPPAARWFTSINLALNGPEFHDALMRGRLAYTDQRVRAVFEHWLELFETGCFGDQVLPQSYGGAIEDLTDGDAAMYNLGEWIFEGGGIATDDVDFFPMPVIDETVARSDLVHVYGFAIPAAAEQMDLAEALLVFLTSEEALLASYPTVERALVDTSIRPEGYADRHERVLEFLDGAQDLTQLFEFSTARPVAQTGLRVFADFLRKVSTGQDVDLDSLLVELEEARLEAYGPLS